ncbi:MAG: GNAT family N-acetyltransferase [Bacteroidales bacterium]|jgi:ribosomal protein S18 acetylase RimI-like enzyme|nr:GNAT family N-acetyltransferase [Bacteroidales bacterium]
MNFTRINSAEHALFMQAWQLYRKSFPPEERRRLNTQRKIMNHRQYHFELITDNNMFVGFILWWGFNDVRYIEHLATMPHLRGKGYGQRILNSFITASNIPVLLEVEHPADNISRRRIGFYQRAGFVLNEHKYSHPPYKKGGQYVSLMLMTCPDAITGEQLKRFLKQHHPVIHELTMDNG